MDTGYKHGKGNIYDNTQIGIYDTTRAYAFGDIIKS